MNLNNKLKTYSGHFLVVLPFQKLSQKAAVCVIVRLFSS